MTGAERDARENTALGALLTDVILPILFPGSGVAMPPDLPRRSIEVLDRVGDLEVGWEKIARILGDSEMLAATGRNFRAGDTLAKTGRTVTLRLSGGRTFTPPAHGAAAGLGISLSAEESLVLEFRSGAEVFEDGAVQKRFLAARRSLPAAAADDILAAAVLPQTSALFGVNTPLKANLFGFSFSLRFGIVLAERGRIRLFAAGPMVKEIPL